MKDEKYDFVPETACDEGEIDLKETFGKIWRRRRFVLRLTAAFTVFGLLVAILQKPLYRTTCTFVPEKSRSGTSSSSLSSLAAMAGVNLGDMSSGASLSPLIYPQLLENVDFNKELMRVPLHLRKYSEPVSLYDLYTDPAYRKFNLGATLYRYTIGLPRTVVDAIKGKPEEIEVPVSADGVEPVVSSYTREEYAVSRRIRKMLRITVEKKEGYLSLSATSREALVSAELCRAAVDILQRYVRDFKLTQARASLEYIRDRYDEAKADYIEKQNELAGFLDSNRGMLTASVQATRSSLGAEYEISKALFTEISKQLLQAEMKVKEDTPTLSIVKAPSVPMRTANSRTRTLMAWVAAGFLLSCIGALVLEAMAARGRKLPFKCCK